MEPRWPQKSYVVLYQVRRRLQGEFQPAWTRFLDDRADWLQGHSPELFSKHANRWRVPKTTKGTRGPSEKAGSIYKIDQEA